MKKTFLFLILVLSIITIQAQEGEKDNIETIFKKPTKIRGYIVSITSLTPLNGENAYMSGVQVGGIFNDQFILGFYQVHIENNIFEDDNSFINSDLDFDHKGLLLGYIFMPKRIIHFNTNVQLGKGDLDIYNHDINRWTYDDFIFVVSPSVEMEFNVAKFFRVGIGANYRFAFDVDQIENYNNEDFSDFGAFVSLKFGWFK
ncbi:MAG: hypothetical protein JEY96_15235 [Bacteroidales bacterium]|nr:hypothetical protein [Bacteroidales bacterium]